MEFSSETEDPNHSKAAPAVPKISTPCDQLPARGAALVQVGGTLIGRVSVILRPHHNGVARECSIAPENIRLEHLIGPLIASFGGPAGAGAAERVDVARIRKEVDGFSDDGKATLYVHRVSG